ncbi:MAG: hydroxyacid dehydrogenase [Actinomycetota bacterium]|nr:hydroxyacid dehydrogenase [Actinomycetota bacterium]
MATSRLDELPVSFAPRDPSPAVAAAVVEAGGRVVGPEEAEALLWTDFFDAGGLADVLASAPGIRWVQLPAAGVDVFRTLVDDGRFWTCAKGAYAEPVAEHALVLGLAGLRRLPMRARATEWGPSAGTSLFDRKVTIVGGGGITAALLRLLAPFRVDATVVRRSARPLAGASHVVGPEHLDDALAGALLVVLALALTPETAGIVGRDQLALMGPDTWLVNVARGAHVVTDELVDALRARRIGGAALDVADPEPLPSDHPLWSLDNCLITPHVADTLEMAQPLLARRVGENVRRYRQREPLLGVVDPALGY